MPKTKTKVIKIPYYFKPNELSYEDWQILLRKQFGQDQTFDFKNIDKHPIFSDFEIKNKTTQKTYKVSIRDQKRDKNFCSCLDFKTNKLGTCKHIEFMLFKVNYSILQRPESLLPKSKKINFIHPK